MSDPGPGLLDHWFPWSLTGQTAHMPPRPRPGPALRSVQAFLREMKVGGMRIEDPCALPTRARTRHGFLKFAPSLPKILFSCMTDNLKILRGYAGVSSQEDWLSSAGLSAYDGMGGP